MPGKRDPDDPNYLILRIDYGVSSGYHVRMCRGAKTFTKYFGSEVCGGDVEALVQARKYRDDLLKKHGLGKGSVSRRGHWRAKPGYGYLTRAIRHRTESDGSETHYDVWYGYLKLDDGKYYTTVQGIDRHGDYGAFYRARKNLEIERVQLATRLKRAKLPPPIDMMPVQDEPPVSMRDVRKRRKAS